MADEATENADGGGGENKGKLKKLIMLGGILVGEAVALLVVFNLLTGPPDVGHGGAPEMDEEMMALERVVEVQVLDSRLENARTGVTFVYPTEIYAHVKARDEARLREELALAADIEAEIRAIWRMADPNDFQEPHLQSLRRKVTALLNERVGSDAESGEPLLQKLIIVMGTGYRADA